MASPLTVNASDAVGQMVEYIQKVELLQETEGNNPNDEDVIQNLNFDFDTNTWTAALGGTFSHAADPVTGLITVTVDDPYVD